MTLRIGTAGWTIPKQHAAHFAKEGSHLKRCAGTFNCLEINSSFHRPHMPKTWARWASTAPEGFRFAVKIPKTITHTAKLLNTGALLTEFLSQVSALGGKLGPLLIQLPPKLEYDEGVAHEFFTTFRELYAGPAVLEPRHASWFGAPVDRELRGFGIARVAADPPKGSALAANPGGETSLRYFRLHGAPRTYYSPYSATFLKEFAKKLAEPTKALETWVIFDNTALGHAAENAVTLRQLTSQKKRAARKATRS